MLKLYVGLAALHLILVAFTGLLWTIRIVAPNSFLNKYSQEIRVVHLASLYLVGHFLSLGLILERLNVDPIHWLSFPLGLFALLFFSTVAYYLPREPGADGFHYWIKGKPLWVSSIGIVILCICLCWLAVILVQHALSFCC